MAPAPEIAVIVGAYTRQEYLLSAMRSLEEQTLARDRFEIVVTKNFHHAGIDRALDVAGATVLFDEERQIGRWLRRAVDRSTAPIVTFLDDDDEFEPQRLDAVLRVWREHPDLGFYRNRVGVIDGQGRPVPPERWREHEVDLGFDSLGAVYRPANERGDLLEIATRRTTSTFNTSSMAIHRELLDGDVGEAFEGTQLEDSFLFLAGALAPRGVYLDDRRLTRFRYYGGNVTHTVRWLGDAATSQRAMAELADRYGRRDLADWMRGLSTHYQRMFDGSTLVDRVKSGASRTEVARRAVDYVRFLGGHPGERRLDLDTWAAAAYGLAYPVAPRLVRRIARARVTARDDPAPTPSDGG